METPVFRKPRMYFDTMPHPPHVTFDDGREFKWLFPWAHFVWARWDYGERDALKIVMGDWLIIVQGRRLDPLYAAIAERTLACLGVRPDFAQDREREGDTFATEISFLRVPRAPEQNGQIEFDFRSR